MRALITGITGQDGSYMAELLLQKNYEVYGLVRRSTLEQFDRIGDLKDRLQLVEGDLTDQSSLDRIARETQPHEVYNFAAHSFVPTSWIQPELTADINGLGALRMLEALRKHCPKAKFLQASSSEMFGRVQDAPQNENTPFYPRSPYGAAKVFAHQNTVNYRENYGMFACAAISFNHESPRRGLEFLTRKVTHQVARIKCGLARKLSVGNLDARRDWGFAGDYVMAMWAMLQQPEPEDFVIATGVSHAVRDVIETAFSAVDLDWRDHLEIDPKLLRPAEVGCLLGDAAKARGKLGWQPQVSFRKLIEMMVHSDLQLVRGTTSSKTTANARIPSSR